MHLRQWIGDLVGFCYPSRCNHCDGALPTRRLLCDECDAEMCVLAAAPACEQCGKPIAAVGGPCPFCLGKGVRPYGRIARLGVFDEPLKSLITAAKFRGRWTLAEELAKRLFDQSSVQSILALADCLMATPLHPLRQLSRGYNQSAVLADALASLSRRKLGRRLPVIAPAVRLRHTPPQTSRTSRTERLRNLRHAFGLLKPDAVRDRRIVVVDDVMTTGATLRSLAGSLQTGWPASLDAVVLAVADWRGRDFQAV